MINQSEILIWTRALFSVMEDEGGNPAEAALRLEEILKKKKKAYLLSKIIRGAKSLYYRKHGVKISLAKEHSEDFVQEIKGKLLSSFGKKPGNTEVCVEPDLIGGFRMKGGNFLVKASVKDFLDEIKSNIN